jgi:hypothetical protein
MSLDVENSIIALLKRSSKNGRTATVQEIETINRDCQNIIPDWYAELLLKYPICGLELGWQRFEEEDFDGVEWVEWSDPFMMHAVMTDSDPFNFMRQHGYLNVANLTSGDENPYFINIEEGENPRVVQIYHDHSPDYEITLKEGIDVIAGSLSEFFQTSLTPEL